MMLSRGGIVHDWNLPQEDRDSSVLDKLKQEEELKGHQETWQRIELGNDSTNDKKLWREGF